LKLAVIYSVWDSEELLAKSIECIYSESDLIILVYQQTSNFGEQYDPLPNIEHLQNEKVILVKYEPDLSLGGMMNERIKRNIGIQFAKANHCTHFLHIDCDEFYENFKECKRLYFKSGHAGSVCKLKTYFQKPTFQFDTPEDYFVPFIHELKEDTKSGASSYKYYVDPTRTVNEIDIVELPIFMHHFSWCRKDVLRKMRNSSANMSDNRVIKNKLILEDYQAEITEGFLVRNWNRRIVVVPDQFNLTPIFQ